MQTKGSTRTTQITALLVKARDQLSGIEAKYKASLNAKRVPDDLKIEIKNYLENLRSALDYLAHEIRDRHCSSAKPKDKCYFPIVANKQDFTGRMAQWFPGLDKSNPDLYTYLESIQPYNGNNKKWLLQFNQITQDHKHVNLVEQVQVSRAGQVSVERVSVSRGGREVVSWNPKAVQFGASVRVAGVPVDPRTQLPVPDPSIKVTKKVTKEVWVDFMFQDFNISSISLMRQSLSGIDEVVRTVVSLL